MTLEQENKLLREKISMAKFLIEEEKSIHAADDKESSTLMLLFAIGDILDGDDE